MFISPSYQYYEIIRLPIHYSPLIRYPGSTRRDVAHYYRRTTGPRTRFCLFVLPADVHIHTKQKTGPCVGCSCSRPLNETHLPLQLWLMARVLPHSCFHPDTAKRYTKAFMCFSLDLLVLTSETHCFPQQ